MRPSEAEAAGQPHQEVSSCLKDSPTFRDLLSTTPIQHPGIVECAREDRGREPPACWCSPACRRTNSHAAGRKQMTCLSISRSK